MKKRILSIILVMTIVLGSANFVLASEIKQEDAATKDYSEAELKELAKDEADGNIGKVTTVELDAYTEALYEEHNRIMSTVKETIAKYVKYDTDLAKNTSKNIDFIVNNVELLEKSVERELLETYIHKVNIYVTEKQYKEVNEFLGMKVFSEEANLSPIIMVKSVYPGYDRQDAVDYAHEYCGDYLGTCDETGYNDADYPIYDTSYQTAGADCANFVSQCLKAGGMDEVGTNINYASSWFCNSSVRNNYTDVSITWRSAYYFPNYWKNNCLKYKMIDSDDVASEADYEDDVFDYLFRGDVVSLCDNDGNAIHTVIITAYGATGSISDLKYSAHTYNRKDQLLYDAIQLYDKARLYSFYN